MSPLEYELDARILPKPPEVQIEITEKRLITQGKTSSSYLVLYRANGETMYHWCNLHNDLTDDALKRYLERFARKRMLLRDKTTE